METDKKVNLIYGLNGTGKSTFSDYLYNITDSKYKDCSIEGFENDELLVYNQSFIKENFLNLIILKVFLLYQKLTKRLNLKF